VDKAKHDRQGIAKLCTAIGHGMYVRGSAFGDLFDGFLKKTSSLSRGVNRDDDVEGQWSHTHFETSLFNVYDVKKLGRILA